MQTREAGKCKDGKAMTDKDVKNEGGESHWEETDKFSIEKKD